MVPEEKPRFQVIVPLSITQNTKVIFHANNFRELQGNAILALSIHPGGRRLLVHCRSLSTPVIMIDLKLHTIMQTFMGSQSFKNRVSSCITPCGTYVISSSQDGAVYVWNADNGQQVTLILLTLDISLSKRDLI